MSSRSSPSVQSSPLVVREGPSCYILLPFDPKPVFGTVRAPVAVTIGGYTFRSRIVAMGGPICVGCGRATARPPGSKAARP